MRVNTWPLIMLMGLRELEVEIILLLFTDPG